VRGGSCYYHKTVPRGRDQAGGALHLGGAGTREVITLERRKLRGGGNAVGLQRGRILLEKKQQLCWRSQRGGGKNLSRRHPSRNREFTFVELTVP